MSTTIDEKVVSMQFDNQQFEKGVSTTMSSLDKLKESLNFKGADKGFEEISTASKRVDFSVLSNGVEAVRMKFSALQIVGITALQNITNAAINYGKRIVSALTIDPVRTGLNEYELKMTSVNTILNSTGESLETVNKYLEELNKYSDQTIYSFQDMTSNIGKFTNAGVKLEDAVSAIKGISNVAAVSGANTNEASRAMYNFSQALSAGYVKLIDWKSIENANMATVEFKNQLLETALALGTVTKNADGTYTTLKGNAFSATKNFNEVLQDQWMTSEVLVQTLAKYSDETTEIGKKAYAAATEVKTFSQLLDTLKESAQSGWAQTWELLVGDLDQAKKLWTGVSDVIGGIISRSAEARNSLLKGALGSGWNKLLDEGIMDEKGYGNYIKVVAKEHGVAIDQMIKDEGSLEKALKKGLSEGTISTGMLSDALNRLTKKYGSLSKEQLTNLGYTEDQVKTLAEFNEKIQNGTVSMGEFAEGMTKLSGRELIFDSIANVWKALMAVIEPVKEAFREIFPKTTSKDLFAIIEAVNEFTKKLMISDEQAAKIKDTFKGFFAVLDIVASAIKSVANVIFNTAGIILGFGNDILSVSSSFGEFLSRIRDSIKESNIFAEVGDGIVSTLQNIVSAIKDVAASLKAKIQLSGFDGFLSLLKGIWNFVKNIFSSIGKMISGTFGGGSGGIFDILTAAGIAGVVYQLKNLTGTFGDVADSFKDMVKGFVDSLGAIATIFDSLGDTLKIFQGKLKAETMAKLATAIIIFAGALMLLSTIDEDGLVRSLSAITIALGLMYGFIFMMNKIKNIKSTLANVVSLIALSSALLLLSVSLKLLSTMDMDETFRALIAMGGALYILSIMMDKLGDIGKKHGSAMSGATQIMILSGALIALSVGLKILSTISWDKLWPALIGMGLSLGILLGTVDMLAEINSKEGAKSIKGTTQLVILSGALISLGLGLKLLSTIEWEDLWPALVAMAGAFAILTVVLSNLSDVNDLNGSKCVKGASQLAIISGVLTIVALDLKLLATMSWDDIWRGLTAMGLALTALTGVMALMALITKINGQGALTTSSLGILAMAGALTALIPVLIILGNLNIWTIVQGFATIIGVIAVFAVAASKLQALIPTMLSFSYALIAFGAGLALVGAGVFLIGSGFAALFGGIVALLAGGVAVVIELGKALIELIPFLIVKVGEGIIALLKFLSNYYDLFGEFLAGMLLSAIDALVTVIPALAEGFLKILTGVLDAMVRFIPNIIESVIRLLMGIMEGLLEFMPQLIQTAIKVFVEFMGGVADALGSIDTSSLGKAIAGVGLLAGLMAVLAATVSLVPAAMLGVLGMAAVVAEIGAIVAAFGLISKLPFLQELIVSGGNLLQTIGTAIGQFIGGIIGGIGQGVTASLPSMATDLSAFMTNLQPFIDGLRVLNPTTLESGKILASLIMTITAANLINSLTGFLGSGISMAVFASELALFGTGIRKFADEVSGISNLDTLKTAAEAGKNLGEMAKAIPTTGGLWDLIAGKNDLSGFGDQLESFGIGIRKFAAQVGNIDGDTVKGAAEAGKVLGEMAQAIPTTGGLWGVIKGKLDMSQFGDQLGHYADAVANFSDYATNVDPAKVNAGVDAGVKIAEMAKSIPTSGGLLNALKGKLDMKKFADQLKEFAKGVKGFVDELGGVEDITSTIEQVETLSLTLQTFSVSAVDNLSKPFNEGSGEIIKSVQNMLDKMIETLVVKTAKLVDSVGVFMKSFKLAVETNGKNVVKEFEEIVDDSLDAIKSISNYIEFQKAGEYLAEGFAVGVGNKKNSVVEKAKQMAQAALSAINSALRINSPSKESMKSGESIDEGLVVGMIDHQGEVEAAATEVADTALNSMRHVLARVGDTIADGVDTQPVITPVLNLKEIKAGANSINGMFNMTPSVGVLAKTGSISSIMNSNQNRGNDDVVSAIDGLKKSLSDISGDTYNINGVTYDDGSQLQAAISTIMRAARIERRR